MYTPITTIRDLTDEVQRQLRDGGIKCVEQLREHGATETQRRELALRTGISCTEIERLVNCADLLRLHGVGGDLSFLLQKAGILNCRHLQQCTPERLYKRLTELHIGQRIGYHAPTLAQVRSWIREATLLADESPT